MLAWYLAAAFGGIALGALGALVFAYLLAETLLKIYDKLENPGTDPESDPEEERLDLIAIRDLLTAIEAIGHTDPDDDAEHRAAMRQLLDASDRARDRFEDLIDDLDDEAESDERTCAPTTTAGV